MRRLELVVVSFAPLLAFAGCASPLTQADRAFDRGDYEQAADMYEQLPAGTTDTSVRMQEARRRALAQRLDRFESSKGDLEAALEELSVVLGQKLEWQAEAFDLTARLDAAVQWGRARVRMEVDAYLASHRPRAAQRLLARRSRFLQSSEFTKLRTDLKGRIHAEAVSRCNALETELASPYLRHFAAAYCNAVGGPWPQESHLPFTIGRFEVDTRVDGLTAAQNERLVTKLNASLRTTPWYSPSAPEVGRAHVEGKLTADFHVDDVVMSAAYTERVPYLDTESYQEPYDESYLETEWYTDQVPDTVWTTESYHCGTASWPDTCSRRVPHTENRSVTRSRQVTRHRTAYRTQQRTVTRYRNVARTHEYDAREHRGHYVAAWRVVLEEQDWPSALSLQFQGNDSQTEIEHDETFEPADLVPSHPTLPSQEQWADRQLDHVTRELIDTMTSGWTDAFCAKRSYEPEEAARCVYGDRDDAPVLAKEVLRRAFHGDVFDFAVPLSR